MNRAFRKRIQRLLESRPPVKRGGDPRQDAVDALWDRQYRRTLELLNEATPERAPEIAIALSHSLHEAAEEATRVAQEWHPNSREGVQCKAGCNWCCHEPLQVSILDAIGVAAVDLSTPLDYRLDMPLERHSLKQTFLACPMLVDGMCSVYASRPVICRAYHSLNVQRCQEIVQAQIPGRQVPMHLELYGFAGLPQEGALQALAEVGIDRRPVVLGLAVRELRDNFEAMTRDWLTGGNAFDRVAVL